MRASAAGSGRAFFFGSRPSAWNGMHCSVLDAGVSRGAAEDEAEADEDGGYEAAHHAEHELLVAREPGGIGGLDQGRVDRALLREDRDALVGAVAAVAGRDLQGSKGWSR